MTLNHVLAHRADIDADRVALIFEATDGRWVELSYGDLHEQASRLAAGLARSVGKGDHVVPHFTSAMAWD